MKHMTKKIAGLGLGLALVLGCGVKPENVRTVDPYDLKATAAVVKEVLSK